MWRVALVSHDEVAVCYRLWRNVNNEQDVYPDVGTGELPVRGFDVAFRSS